MSNLGFKPNLVKTKPIMLYPAGIIVAKIIIPIEISRPNPKNAREYWAMNTIGINLRPEFNKRNIVNPTGGYHGEGCQGSWLGDGISNVIKIKFSRIYPMM